MKKSLLLINCYSVCLFFISCQSAQNQEENKMNDNTQTIIEDSIAKDKADIQQVISKPVDDKTNKSNKQTTTVNAKNTSTLKMVKNDTLIHSRIEHGSDNKTKLDSIKKAKGKLKK